MDKSDMKENKGKLALFTYDEATGILTLREFKIKNKNVVDYLRSYPIEKQEEAMNDVLEFGVKSLKSFLTENYGKTIDVHFKNGFSDLDSKLSQKVGQIDKDVFQVFLDRAREKVVDDFSKKFDEKKESLMTIMRETNQKLDKDVLRSFIDDLKDKVFATFKTDFTNISEDLKKGLKGYAVEREFSAKTPLKGSEFENYIVLLSEGIAKSFGDDIDHVGSDNLAGDILVQNISDGLRFCIEAKDTSLTNPQIKDTFEKMEKVRKVQHSIIVFRNTEEVPKTVDSFHLWGRNRLELSVAGEPDENPNPFLFNVGYRIMRFLTLSERPLTKEIDIGAITKHVENIASTIKAVGSLKAKVTSFSKDLNSDLDELKREIEDELKEIEEIMKG